MEYSRIRSQSYWKCTECEKTVGGEPLVWVNGWGFVWCDSCFEKLGFDTSWTDYTGKLLKGVRN
jgi:hypothetical protein